MTQIELKKRTKDFAHRCVKLALSLPKGDLGKHISKQLIRCSASVAANYRATCLAQSKKAFSAKLSIVVEEADETSFWMEFSVEENLIRKNRVELLLHESYELTSIFIASRKTSQGNKKTVAKRLA
jgi:four helix bundle protein